MSVFDSLLSILVAFGTIAMAIATFLVIKQNHDQRKSDIQNQKLDEIRKYAENVYAIIYISLKCMKNIINAQSQWIEIYSESPSDSKIQRLTNQHNIFRENTIRFKEMINKEITPLWRETASIEALISSANDQKLLKYWKITESAKNECLKILYDEDLQIDAKSGVDEVSVLLIIFQKISESLILLSDSSLNIARQALKLKR